VVSIKGAATPHSLPITHKTSVIIAKKTVFCANEIIFKKHLLMKIPFFIAWRYLRTTRNRNLVHRIGLVAFWSIALSTMALIISLSIYNGLEDLTKSMFKSFDPDIKICLKKGKKFILDENLITKIKSIEGVALVMDVLEDNALLLYENNQMVIKVKGVSSNFIQNSRLKESLILGSIKLNINNSDRAIIGAGVQYILGVNLGNKIDQLHFFYPTNASGKIFKKSYNSKSIVPGGVFAIAKQFDESYVIVPMHFATKLMNSENKRTALEIYVKKGYDIGNVQHKIISLVQDTYKVLNNDQQQYGLTNAISIERFLVYLIFFIILLVASLNIFFMLSMLIVIKQNDISILHTMGVSKKNIMLIFLLEAVFISLISTVLGVIIALIVIIVQQNFGIIHLGDNSCISDVYPTIMHLKDFVYTTMCVIITTLVAAVYPAWLASKSVGFRKKFP